MPGKSQLMISDASANQQSAEDSDLDVFPGKAGNLAVEILLKTFQRAVYLPENEQKFTEDVFEPQTLRRPFFGADLRNYSAVNRLWRAVIRDVRTFDIICFTTQQVEHDLEGLIDSDNRSIHTFLWESPQHYSNHLSLAEHGDHSTLASRTRLFKQFLEHVNGSIKALILRGLKLERNLNVANYGGWQRVTHFSYASGSLLDCGRLITSLLVQLQNLESLHLSFIKCRYWFPFLPRPTYSLSCFSASFVEDQDFLEWTGGNSRGTLRELYWSAEDDVCDPALKGRFKDDLSDIFPGSNVLSLRRLAVRGRYICLLQHCDLVALKWLNISFR